MPGRPRGAAELGLSPGAPRAPRGCGWGPRMSHRQPLRRLRGAGLRDRSAAWSWSWFPVTGGMVKSS